jgi:hypothetical protein
VGSQFHHGPRFHKPPYDPGKSDFPIPVLASALHAFSDCRPSLATRNLSVGQHAPRLTRFFLQPRPDALSAVIPVLSPDTISAIETAECPEPLCLVWALPSPGRCSTPPQWTLLHLHSSYWLMRQSHDLYLLSLRMKGVFAGCCHPLLLVGPSRHYPCNHCAGAWTLTPP